MARKRKFKIGERVVTMGNRSRRGVIDGYYRDLYVIKLDEPIRIGRVYAEIILHTICHPDNVMSEEMERQLPKWAR